jgi:hypothetical protein
MEPTQLPTETARLIDAYAEALKEYAAFTHEIGREHGSLEEVADDPRVEDAYWRLSLLGAEVDKAFETELGVRAPVDTAFEPDDPELADDEDADDEDGIRILSLSMVIDGGEGDVETLPDWLAEQGKQLVNAILDQGIEVREWVVALEAPAEADDEDDDLL